MFKHKQHTIPYTNALHQFLSPTIHVHVWNDMWSPKLTLKSSITQAAVPRQSFPSTSAFPTPSNPVLLCRPFPTILARRLEPLFDQRSCVRIQKAVCDKDLARDPKTLARKVGLSSTPPEGDTPLTAPVNWHGTYTLGVKVDYQNGLTR